MLHLREKNNFADLKSAEKKVSKILGRYKSKNDFVGPSK